jgi:integrase
VRYLSPEEETRLRAVMAEKWPEHLPELDLALHTGLRRGEMYGLGWQDVNLAQRFLRVRCGKNGESRHVRLNTVALQALADLRKRGDGTGSVIRNLAGEPLCGPRHWFDKAVGDQRADIPDFHWHDLRHYAESRTMPSSFVTGNVFR